ncbi:MAG: VWA domain-containing protein [Endomicrobium sp.]|jgi:Ca-activated chloride channel family protein|nr:VWA domain-containing protein [Endomicrobium sp.]
MFVDKNYLLLLLIIIPLAACGIFFFKKRKKDLALFVSLANLSSLSNVNIAVYALKYMLICAAFVFIILALARPQYGDKPQEVKKEYSEIIMALDISKSMLAQDIKPSRLERAKAILMRIIEENAGEKIGIIVFAGTAMWQCPMTFDIDALKMFFEDIRISSLPMGGTQISGAINLAAKSVAAAPAKSKVLILISDGEDHDSKIKEALANAKKSGLRIITVAIGTRAGAPILLKNSIGQNLDYVRDRSGQVVMTKVNAGLLSLVAKESDGKYFECASAKDISGDLVKAVKDIEKNKDGSVEQNNKYDRFQIFLFAAFILLIAETLVAAILRKRK